MKNMWVSISASMENEPEIQLLSLINFCFLSFAVAPYMLKCKIFIHLARGLLASFCFFYVFKTGGKRHISKIQTKKNRWLAIVKTHPPIFYEKV